MGEKTAFSLSTQLRLKRDGKLTPLIYQDVGSTQKGLELGPQCDHVHHTVRAYPSLVPPWGHECVATKTMRVRREEEKENLSVSPRGVAKALIGTAASRRSLSPPY